MILYRDYLRIKHFLAISYFQVNITGIAFIEIILCEAFIAIRCSQTDGISFFVFFFIYLILPLSDFQIAGSLIWMKKKIKKGGERSTCIGRAC